METPVIDVDSDPRVTGEYVWQVSGDLGSVTVVGVVHDHPASTYRVRHVIKEVDPDVLALELPPISLALFEQYADTDQTPPDFGGEMSAAIQAAETNIVVGIDRPTVDFFKRLGLTLLRERPPVATVRNVVSTAVETTYHALRCLTAAAISAHISRPFKVSSPISHNITQMDAPTDQAHHEREHVHRCRSFMNAFQTTNHLQASRIEDTAREEAMAIRLGELHENENGDIVAVVGIDHIESLAEKLAKS